MSKSVPGVTLVAFEQLLAESDFVTLHLPLTDSNHHMLDSSAFQQMKSSAYLINTSRGPLVDHSALAIALEQGEIAGAALDVQEPEPPDLSQPPFNDPRVIITPHAAFVSVESLIALRLSSVQNTLGVLLLGESKNTVNF